MKKTLTVLIVCAALAAGSCSKGKGGGVRLRSDVDSIAYIIGLNVGANLLRMDSTIRVDAVCEGIRDALLGTPKLTAEQAETYFLSYITYMLPEKARGYEEQFLSDLAKSNRSYTRTSSGVTYKIDVVGDQNQIPASDRDSVLLHFSIRSKTGVELYSSQARGDTLKMALSELKPGIKESVKLIGKGGKISAWLPSSLAYGAEGDSRLGIKPNATIYCEIELVDVDKYANRSRKGNLR